MRPEHACHARPRAIERLSDALFALAGHHDVRVIEALAAVFCNRQRAGIPGWPGDLAEPADQHRFTAPSWDTEGTARRAICRRIASRALRGSLVDPTRGATTVHRIEASPPWSRDLLPIGMFGPFLFYRMTPGELRACEEHWACSPSARLISDAEASRDEAPIHLWWPDSSSGGPDGIAF